MDKEKYFEMCEAMNTEPEPSEIPPEFEDLTVQAQEAYEITTYLPDNWSEMSGGYIGKDLSNISTFFELFNVPRSDWLLYMELIYVVIEERKTTINKKVAAASKQEDAKLKAAANLAKR